MINSGLRSFLTSPWFSLLFVMVLRRHITLVWLVIPLFLSSLQHIVIICWSCHLFAANPCLLVVWHWLTGVDLWTLVSQLAQARAGKVLLRHPSYVQNNRHLLAIIVEAQILLTGIRGLKPDQFFRRSLGDVIPTSYQLFIPMRWISLLQGSPTHKFVGSLQVPGQKLLFMKKKKLGHTACPLQLLSVLWASMDKKLLKAPS